MIIRQGYKNGIFIGFKKGYIPWNKGKHIALNNALETWRKNGGHNNTEIKKGQHLSSNTEFKRGLIHTEKFKEYLSKIMKGRKFTEEWKRKIGKANSGENQWNWKGGISKDKTKYERDRYSKDNKYRMARLNNNRKRRSGGILSIQTIQRVYEDNIKQFGTLTCYLCFKPIEFHKDCLEHKIPLSRGGTNEYNNLAISHRSCNNKKFNKTEEEYRKMEVCY